jgi:hypothetical protein
LRRSLCLGAQRQQESNEQTGPRHLVRVRIEP